MRVLLKDLKPNPLRDFTIDPIDRERVETLSKSIQEDGFWGGVVCRSRSGEVEIAAGQHRVEAAIDAGIVEADLFVADDMSDSDMVRIYARENATQRGNTGTALAGSVASAIKVVAKYLLCGEENHLSGIPDRLFSDAKSRDIAKGQLLSEAGLGAPILSKFLHDTPGITSQSIKLAIANLKASGNYARIIDEVREELQQDTQEEMEDIDQAIEEAEEAEAEEKRAYDKFRKAQESERRAKDERSKLAAQEAKEKASKEAEEAARRKEAASQKAAAATKTKKVVEAADKAAQAAKKSSKRVFDFEGVSKYLKNPHQIDVFRQEVTNEKLAKYLPVDQQAPLAEELVRLAESGEGDGKKGGAKQELTGAFIKNNIYDMVFKVQKEEKRQSKQTKNELRNASLVAKSKQYQDDFCRLCRSLSSTTVKLRELHEQWPKDLPFEIVSEFRSTVKQLKTALDSLTARLPKHA